MEDLTREIYALAYPEVPFERIKLIKGLVLEKKKLLLDYGYYFENTTELQNRAIEHTIQFSTFIKVHDLSPAEQSYVLSYYPDLSVIHSIGYFNDTLEFLGSPTQIAFYQHLIDSNQLVGSYSQSELGNGSSLRGIETQAIYNIEKQQFIINSPTITSSKFWIGGKGLHSNYTILIARLIIENVDYGPHAFIAQIRNFRSHKPAKGAFIGEIGPKMGLSSSDHGFARYEFLSIPKTALLNRFCDIDRNGKYSKRFDNYELLNMTHIIARVGTVCKFWTPLAAALTISLKYSNFRQQFPDPEDPSQEVKIIKYQIQQHKLFPPLARLYCFLLSFKSLRDSVDSAIQGFKKGDDSYFIDIYCLSSLYKVGITSRYTEDIETCRRACGGHGYLKLSGLPLLYNNALPSCTFAGDNTVISIETIKQIIKFKPKQFWFDIVHHHEMNKHQYWLSQLAKYHLKKIDSKFNELIRKGISESEIWDRHLQVQSLVAADALFLAVIHKEILRNLLDSKHKKVFGMFREIFVENEIKKFEGDLRLLGIQEDEWEALRGVTFGYYEELSEKALEYIEAFDLPDEMLNSVLTKASPYEEMLWTSKNLNPINDPKIRKKFNAYLRPKL